MPGFIAHVEHIVRTVGELRARLNGLPDDMPIKIDGMDDAASVAIWQNREDENDKHLGIEGWS